MRSGSAPALRRAFARPSALRPTGTQGLYQVALKDVALGLGRLWLVRLALEIVSQNTIHQSRKALATALSLSLKRDRHFKLYID
jgi:hypothetical protein